MLALAAALILANLTPLWEGTLVATNLARPEQLPRYVTEAAHYLNSTGSDRGCSASRARTSATTATG